MATRTITDRNEVVIPMAMAIALFISLGQIFPFVGILNHLLPAGMEQYTRNENTPLWRFAVEIREVFERKNPLQTVIPRTLSQLGEPIIVKIWLSWKMIMFQNPFSKK
jgi:hypothetical protein